MNDDVWHDTIRRTSVPLRTVDASLLPTGSASACIFDYRAHRFLLTAAHSVRRPGRWVVECRWVPGRGTQNYSLGSMGFLTQLDGRTLESRDVDLAYVRVPADLDLREQWNRADGTIARDVPRLLAEIDFAAAPDSTLRYGFAGDVAPRLQGEFLISSRPVFVDLNYCGQVEEGVYGFQLPAEHPGHAGMEGCSGAPILDERGRTVSLVLRGDEADGLVLGIDLRPYRAALDVELMEG